MSVYVFGEPGMLLVKVGYTRNAPARLDVLQRFDKAATSARFLYLHHAASTMTERLAHRLLRERFWVQGEWFVCGAETAKAIVRRAAKSTQERSRIARRGLYRQMRRMARQARPAPDGKGSAR